MTNGQEYLGKAEEMGHQRFSERVQLNWKEAAILQNAHKIIESMDAICVLYIYPVWFRGRR
jgi:hypothetical protein